MDVEVTANGIEGLPASFDGLILEPTRDVRSSTTLAPDREGSRVRLAPVTPNDHRFLFELATSTEMSYRWRYRNQIPRYETFVQQLDVDVLAQFVVRHLPDDAPVGHVVAYGPDLPNGYCYVAGVFGSDVIGLHFGAEGLSIFIDYLFATWDLSKLYAEIPEFVHETIADRLVEPFELEARFRHHLYFGGRHWDLLVYAVARADWPGAVAWEFNPRQPGPRKSSEAEEGSRP